MTNNCRALLDFFQQQLNSGVENGRLTAPFVVLMRELHFAYSHVKPTVNEAVALGLLEVTDQKQGRVTRYRIFPDKQPGGVSSWWD